MSYAVGSTITFDITVRVDDLLDDPDTLLLVVTDPTGETEQLTTSHDGSGHFTATYIPAKGGAHRYELTTADAAGNSYKTGTFWVEDASTTPPDGDIGIVRLLINDVSEPPTFSNFDIQAFLTLEGDVVKLAAAQALDTIASNEALVSKRIRTLDLQTDGPAVAKELRAHAKALREQVAAQLDADEGGELEITTSFGIPGMPLEIFL